MNTHLRDQLLVIEGGAKGQHLIMNDAETAPAYSAGLDIIDRDLSQVDVVSTTDETSIYSHSVAAGSLGATGGIRLTIAGDSLKNATGTLTLRVKLGATTVFTSAVLTISGSANRYKWILHVHCLNVNASSQKWSADIQAAEDTATFALRKTTSSGAFMGGGYNTSAENTAGALTLDVTSQWSASSASLSFRKELALLERIAA